MRFPNIKILNTEPSRFSKKELIKLRNIATIFDYESDREYLINNIKKFDCMLIGLRNKIDKNILKYATNLKFIVTPTTGLNHIDLEDTSDKNIDIISLYGEEFFLKTLTATAELTWGIILCLIRKINSAHLSVLKNQWDRDKFKGKELNGLTLGIIGYGRLGSMVAKYGEAFNMKVIIHDINPEIKSNFKKVDLNTLLSSSDVISLHIPLNESNYNFLNKELLYKLKKDSIFINTSRGEIIDEISLLNLLLSGRISGIGLDVLKDEFSSKKDWLKENEFRKYSEKGHNIVLTPHIGGLTKQSAEKANNFIIEKLEKYLVSKYK